MAFRCPDSKSRCLRMSKRCCSTRITCRQTIFCHRPLPPRLQQLQQEKENLDRREATWQSTQRRQIEREPESSSGSPRGEKRRQALANVPPGTSRLELASQPCV